MISDVSQLYQDHLVKQRSARLWAATINSNGSDKSSSFDENFIGITVTDFEQRVLPTTKLVQHQKNQWVSMFIGVASILAVVPGYDLFEERVAVFDYSSRGTSVFFVLRVKSDTSLIHQKLNFRG